MTGRFHIDGRDAYEEYRVFLSEGSAASLLQYPPLKKVDGTDWSEEDGEEVDLTAPRLDTREVSLNFVSHDAGGRFGLFGDFMEGLSDRGYHDFSFPFMERTFRLRLTSHPSMDHLRRADIFTLRFADDFPPCCGEGYERPEPASGVMPYDDYELDGRKLTDYGVRVLEGSLAEVLKAPSVRQNLLVNGDTTHGAWYDGDRVKFKTKEVKLNCLMRAGSYTEFWKSYEAFLYDLTRQDERLLYVDWTGLEYPCYYKGCSSEEFCTMPGVIWWQFTLTLVFTFFRVDAAT